VPAQKLEDLDNIKKEYFDKNGVFYVAEDNGKIIGTIAVKREKGKTARLKRMYVAKRYRKMGVGQRLLSKILKFCRGKGYSKMILSTTAQMAVAINFYKKNEFKRYKTKKGKIFFEKKFKNN
jgi:GNAT superfamily N-acetyltransferase